MGRHWLARLAVSVWAANIAAVSLLAPESLSGRALASSGVMGYVMMFILLGVSLFSLFDIAVNDLMPERFTSALRNWRHVGFMAMAIALTMLGTAIAIKSQVHIILASFLIPAFLAVVVTWADMLDRHRKKP